MIGLRTTIRQLQAENRTLAGSLQQLSTGADLGSVIDSLPERLRSMAVLPPGTAPAAGGGGELGVASPTWRKISDGTSMHSLPNSPWRSSAAEPTPKGQNGLRLHPLQEGGRYTSLQIDSPMSGGSISPFRPVPVGRGRTSANNVFDAAPPPFDNSTSLVPFMSSTQQRRSQQQQPPRHRGPSPSHRASPIGTTSSRFSNTFNGANGTTGSGTFTGPSWSSMVASGRGGGGPSHSVGVLPLDVPLELDPLEFPELAALEEQFQQAMSTGAAGGHAAGAAVASSHQSGAQNRGGGGESRRVAASNISSSSSSAVASSSVAAVEGEEDAPDVRALKWAQKNKWFGSDIEMTEYAYKVGGEKDSTYQRV